jgi:hypothetical protein
VPDWRLTLENFAAEDSRQINRVTTAGQKQFYSLSLAARASQIIYFSSGSCEGGPLSFDLLDPVNI